MKPDIATLEDAPGIASAHIRSWREAYAHILDPDFLASLSIEARAEKWREILAKDESETWVVRTEGQVLGFVSHGACRDAGATLNQGEIFALYVDPRAWGKKVGLALLRHAIEQQRAAGRTAVSLWVLAENKRGIGFYESAGFLRVQDREHFFELGGRQVQEVQYMLRDGALYLPREGPSVLDGGVLDSCG
jgi:ribosomal protein S18 acetylase RimI-like enzyme